MKVGDLVRATFSHSPPCFLGFVTKVGPGMVEIYFLDGTKRRYFNHEVTLEVISESR